METKNENAGALPSEVLRETLGKRLKSAFVASGMKQGEIAALCDIHQSYVSNILRHNGRNISVARLYDLLGVMGVVITVSIPE